MAQKYNASSIPHILFFDSNGKLVKEIRGGPAKGKEQEYQNYVQRIVAKMGLN